MVTRVNKKHQPYQKFITTLHKKKTYKSDDPTKTSKQTNNLRRHSSTLAWMIFPLYQGLPFVDLGFIGALEDLYASSGESPISKFVDKNSLLKLTVPPV